MSHSPIKCADCEQKQFIMNILFVVPYVPNPIRVRPYQLLRTLAARGHQLTVATLWQTEAEHSDIAALEALGIEVIAEPLPRSRSLWNTMRAVPTDLPLQAMYCWQPTLASALQTLIKQRHFDVAHVEHLRGVRYGLLLRQLQQTLDQPLPIVWDSVDCISYLFAQAARQSRSLSSRLLTQMELKRTERYEGKLLGIFDQVLVTSKIDQQALATLAQRHSITNTGIPTDKMPIVLPGGVDLGDPGYADTEGTTTYESTDRAPATLVFSGKMSYHANVAAALYLAEEIMPLIWAKSTAVKVQIVGKDPPPSIRALVKTTEGKIEVTGTVPEMRPYLQKATIAAAPLVYGAGIQNKILEAMACSTPVVTTRQATGGIQAEVGRDFLVADDATHFAEAILTLLNNPTRRKQIGQQGRRYVESTHSWPALAATLEDVYTNTIAQAMQTTSMPVSGVTQMSGAHA